jgi:hypothetical protein
MLKLVYTSITLLKITYTSMFFFFHKQRYHFSFPSAHLPSFEIRGVAFLPLEICEEVEKKAYVCLHVFQSSSDWIPPLCSLANRKVIYQERRSNWSHTGQGKTNQARGTPPLGKARSSIGLQWVQNPSSSKTQASSESQLNDRVLNTS